MKDLLNKLKKKTEEAIQKGKELRAAKMEADTKAERLRHDEAENWANNQIKNVPAVCLEQARQGRNCAIIASTQNKSDKYQARRNNQWNTKNMLGLKFWYLEKKLKEENIPFETREAWDGGGMDSWNNIVVTW